MKFVRRIKMDIIVIDFTNSKSTDEIHTKLKESLKFPDYYRNNWDAFWDMIYDYIESPVIVKIIGLNRLPYELKNDGAIMLDVFNELS
jgi:RNAse (barnase) inhibitor barstar